MWTIVPTGSSGVSWLLIKYLDMRVVPSNCELKISVILSQANWPKGVGGPTPEPALLIRVSAERPKVFLT